MRAEQWGTLLIFLTMAAAHLDNHESANLGSWGYDAAQDHDQSDSYISDQSLDEMRYNMQREQEEIEEVRHRDVGESRAPKRGTVQEFVDPSGREDFTVGVMPTAGGNAIGEGIGSRHSGSESSTGEKNAKKTAAQSRHDTTLKAEKKTKAQKRHSDTLALEKEHKVQKVKKAHNAAKAKADAAKDNLELRHAAEEKKDATEKELKKNSMMNSQVELEVKKANHILKMERTSAQASEIKNKESEQVHKNFITNELSKKEDGEKTSERNKKAEIIEMTLELETKARQKKQSLLGPKGGAMVATGTFTLTSATYAGKQAELKAKDGVAKKKEMDQKDAARVKEIEKKKKETDRRVRIADAVEKMEKDKAIAEKNEKLVFAAQEREKREKEIVGAESNKELIRKAKEKVSKRKPVANVTATNTNTSISLGESSHELIDVELNKDVSHGWNAMSRKGRAPTDYSLVPEDDSDDGAALPLGLQDVSILQHDLDALDALDAHYNLEDLGESTNTSNSTGSGNGTSNSTGSGNGAGSAGDQVRKSLNESAVEREAGTKTIAKEKGQKLAIDEQDEARAKADKRVDEATAKELRAKKAVEKTKKDVAKKAEEELRKLEIDSEAEANNATNSTPMWNESRNGTNSTWDLPTGKPDEWKGYTDVDLKKMLKKAAMKQKFLCKSAELLPNLATKAKAASDQAYVESRRTQVKRVAEISKMDEIEKSKYQERKVKR